MLGCRSIDVQMGLCSRSCENDPPGKSIRNYLQDLSMTLSQMIPAELGGSPLPLLFRQKLRRSNVYTACFGRAG